MQHIELIGGNDDTKTMQPRDFSGVDPADLIYDREEAVAIIRRAVTILWKDQAFTYDELTNHLEKNYVVLPELEDEKRELYEEALLHIWHQQKEIACIALQPLPTRLRYLDNETNETLHGIIIPAQRAVPQAHEAIDEEESDATVANAKDGDVIDITKNQPKLTSVEIAKLLFERLTEVAVYDTVIKIKKISDEIIRFNPSADPSVIDEVIKKMVDNGYVVIRNTGKKKYPHRSIVMDQDTKKDVLDDMAGELFEAGLEHMFADHEPNNTNLNKVI